MSPTQVKTNPPGCERLHANTLTNAAFNGTLTWANPNLTTIERQILVPLFSEFPTELGAAGHEDEILGRLHADPSYRAMFVAAFPNEANPIRLDNVVKSLATFVRTLVSGSSPYDLYVAGRGQLSDSARRGLGLFFSERLECHHCHGGFNFSAATNHVGAQTGERPFHNTGLYNVGDTGEYPPDNRGLFEFTRRPEDMGKFRVPTLRNVGVTAPYMHDGSIDTLEEVIRFYEAGGRNVTSGPYAGDGRKNPHKNGLVSGFTLSASERHDLIEFLSSLTDQRFLSDPALSDPSAG